jgi:Leucine-rich repeat (LRR) protein
MLLYSCRVRLPHEAIKSKVSGEKIVDVIEDDLSYFKNLVILDASDNEIAIDQLKNLMALQKLNLQYNNITSLMISGGMFPNLETLDLGFNRIPSA